ARIKQKRICSKEGKEVPYKQVAKGYEVKSGEYLLLSKDEVAAAAGDHSRLIQLEEFVCAPEIDPVYYEKTYYLGSGEKGADSYRERVLELIAAKRAARSPTCPSRKRARTSPPWPPHSRRLWRERASRCPVRSGKARSASAWSMCR